MTHKLKELEKGVILINKPVGLTSFRVLARVRRMYFPGEKVGHTGTLDSMASGLLILLVGGATKRQGDFTRLPKEYEGGLALGVESDTYSADGQLRFPSLGFSELLERLSSIKKIEIETTFKKFLGEQEQTVPPFSAVQVKGERLHKLARKGRPLPELPSRKIQIERLELLDFYPIANVGASADSAEPFGSELRAELLTAEASGGHVPLQEPSSEEFLNVAPKIIFRACVSSGTYIRSLVVDIGKELGTGAVLTQLTRTRIGHYKLSDAIDLSLLSP